MSFAANLRSELCKNSSDKPCCMRAEGYGMLLGAEVSKEKIKLQSESADVAKHFATLMYKLCGVQLDVAVLGSLYSATAEEDVKKIFDFFYMDSSAIVKRLSRANIEEDCCASSLLRGFFLACGYASSPYKGYRLEFVTRHKQLSKDLCTLLEELSFTPSTTTRRGMNVIYFKTAEAVEMLLRELSSNTCADEVAAARDIRALNSLVNRQINTDNANLNKSLQAAALQVQAINLLIDRGAFDHMEEELLLVAKTRQAHPDANLTDLASLTGLSRSTLNRRLNKIKEMAEKLSAQAEIQSIKASVKSSEKKKTEPPKNTPKPKKRNPKAKKESYYNEDGNLVEVIDLDK